MYTSCSYERFFGDVGQLVYTTGSWLISPLSCIRFDNFYDSTTLGVGPVLRNYGLAIVVGLAIGIATLLSSAFPSLAGPLSLAAV